MDNNLKICKKCKRELLVNLFSIKHSWCKECSRKYSKLYVKRIKLEAHKYLSKDGVPKCSVCGFKDVKLLQIDHVNNDGSKEKTSFDQRFKGTSMYNKILKLPREEARERFQSLCIFHNWARRYGKKAEEYKVIVLKDDDHAN